MNRQPFKQTAAAAALAMTLMTGCSDAPEALVASAKQYLARKDSQAAVIQLRNALQQDPDIAEARFLLGTTLLEAGDFAGAEKELRRALELQYPAEQAVPPLARTLVRLGRYKEVVTELVRVQITSPRARAELLTAAAEAHLALRNFPVAERAFTAALASEPGHIPAYLGQARLAANDGKPALAMEKIDAALALAPAEAEAWQLKGDLLLANKEVEPALAAYRKALEAAPSYLPARTSMVMLLMGENRLDDAAKQLEAMQQVAPTRPQTLYLQALLGYRQKRFTDARAAIQQQLRVAPDNLLGLVLAAAIDLELKNYAQAEASALKALQRAPQQRAARRILIATYLRNGQPEKALDALKAVLDRIEGDPDLLALAGEVFMMNSDAPRAAQYFAKAAALDPGDARKRTAVALSHLATGGSDRALKELEDAAAVDSGMRADLGLIAALTQRRQYDKALVAIAALEKKQPASPIPHNLRGGVLLGKRDPVAARQSFERALQLDPGFLPAALNLAQLDIRAGKPDAARKRFEGVLAKNPGNAQALLALAGLRAQETLTAANKAPGNPARQPDQEVLELINRAISAQPRDAEARVALIGYYLSTNDAKQAAVAAQDAVGALPDRPEVLEQAARAYQAGGDTYQALTTYKKLASLQPAFPQPYLRMAEVQAAANIKDEAMESLAKALAIRPNFVDAQLGMIALHLDAGRGNEALAVAREIQKQRPNEQVGYGAEGDIRARQKNWAEAASAYRAALTRGSSTNTAIRLHTVLTQAGGADADKFSATWLREHSKDTTFRLYLAQEASSRKDYPGAAQHYRSVLPYEPDNVVVLNNLAWIEAQLKDPQAVEHAERANKLAPNQPPIMDTLGMLLVDKGETARGLDLIRKASAMAPQATSIRMNLAKALIKVGQKDAARKELDELSKLGDKFPSQAEVAQLRKGL